MRGHHGHFGHHHGHRHYGGRGLGGLGGMYGGGMNYAAFMSLPFYSNNILTFVGPYVSFMQQLNNLTPQEKMGVKVMNVVLTGDTIQQGGLCCIILTMIAGGFCIFPLFCLCFNCFKKAVGQVSHIPTQAYNALDSAIAQFANLQNVSIVVGDALLNANKASLIERNLLSKSKLMNFSFTNTSLDMDLKGTEFTDFDQYFPGIRQSNRFTYSLLWGSKFTNFTNPTFLASGMGMEMTNLSNPY